MFWFDIESVALCGKRWSSFWVPFCLWSYVEKKNGLWNWCRYDHGGISIICLVQSKSAPPNKRSAHHRLWLGSPLPAHAFAWHHPWCFLECCFSLLVNYCPHHHTLHRYTLVTFFFEWITLNLIVSMHVDTDFSFIVLIHFFLWPGTSCRSFFKGIEMWKEETILKVQFTEFLLSRCIIRGISFIVIKWC